VNLGRVSERLRETFALDLRSIAAMRIGIGLVLLADLFHRACDLRAHYTDSGILTISLLRELSSPSYTSIHTLSGGAGPQVFLFAVAAIFAIGLTLGWRTRLVTVVSWFLLVSLHKRNPYLLYGADTLLRMTLFWAMFLPWGARWSLDAKRNGPPGADRAASVATFALVAQFAMVYVFTILHKIIGVEWRNGTAVYYALNINMYTTPLGRYLLSRPELHPAMTYFTLAVEAAIPALLFSPFRRATCRLAAVTINYLFHFGLGLCLMLGLFPVICVVAALPFLPGVFWDRKRPPAGDPLGATFISHALCAAAVLYVCAWNLSNFNHGKRAMPEKMKLLGAHLKINQHWGMFAPGPTKIDGWIVVEAELEDGRKIDLLRSGEPVSYEKPVRPVILRLSHRWQEYTIKALGKKRARLSRAFCEYWIREWRRRGGAEKIRTVRLDYVTEKTLSRGTDPIGHVIVVEFSPEEP